MDRKGNRLENLSVRQAELLLAAVIVARATSFLFTKTALTTMSLFDLLAVRFLIAFLILAVIFRKRLLRADRKTWICGAVLGFGFFVVMTLETSALYTAATSEVSLLENCSVVIVPFLAAALEHRRPNWPMVISAKLALVGVGLMTLSSGFSHLAPGHILAITSAFVYATVIVLTGRFAREADTLSLGVLQVGFLGLFSLIATMFRETPKLPDTGAAWISVLMLVIVCTVFGYTLQPVAQSKASTEKAGLYCALSPVTAASLGVIFLHETLTPAATAGAALILFCIFLPSLWEKAVKSREGRGKGGLPTVRAKA